MRRAAYLCELQCAPIRAEDNTAMPASLLDQQKWNGANRWKMPGQTASWTRWMTRWRQTRRGALAPVRQLIDQQAGLCRCSAPGQSPHVHCAICRRHRASPGSTGTIGRFCIPKGPLALMDGGLHHVEIRISMALLQISEPGQSPDPHQRRISGALTWAPPILLVAAVRNGVRMPRCPRAVSCCPSVVRYLANGGRQIGC